MKKERGTGGGQINTIIFLTRRPISVFEEERWCFEYFRSQGFKVEVFVLTGLLYKNMATCNSVVDLVEHPLQGDFIHYIDSYQEFDHLVRRFSVHSLFVDYVMGNLDLTLKEEKIFRLLGKHGARYTFISNGALPLPSLLVTDKRGKSKAFLSKVVRAITNPSMLWEYVASRVILLLTHRCNIYPLPVVIFGGDSEVLQRYIQARSIEKKTIIPVNSFDYDSCLLLLRSLGEKLPENKDVCVFLDEAATHHPDCVMLGIEPAADEPYFTAMNRFFVFVEKNTGCKVVIAAHPRSNYENMPNVFGGRAVIKGKTVELVAKSKLVVVHSSTSISYAVFFKKPVISLKIPGMRLGSQADRMVETMSVAIGNKPVDLAKDELTPPLLQCGCNLEKYAEYEKRYVRTEGAEELPTWAIVAKTMRNISLGPN